MGDEELEVQEVEEQEVEEQPQETPPDLEMERRAKLMGWVPKDDFRGDPDRWQPATEFVRRADELMPIMKTQLRKYEDRIGAQQSELTTLRKTVERIVKTSETAMERAYEQARADLMMKQAQAVASGDTEQWMKLEQEKEKLVKPEKIDVEQPAESRPNEDNPVFKQWHEDNSWYMSDEDMTVFANAYVQAKPELKQLPYQDYLATVTNAVKRAFPHKFQNPNRVKPAPVGEGASRGNPPGRPKGKTFNDLPQDAREVCDKYVARGLYKSREDYVKVYFSEE